MFEQTLLLQEMKNAFEKLRSDNQEMKKEITLLRQTISSARIETEQKQYQEHFSVKEVSSLIQCSTSQTTSLIRRRKIKAEKVNGQWFVKSEEYRRLENIIKEKGLAGLKAFEFGD